MKLILILTSGDKIKVKIGIHTGKVIPAVVGEHKPQFSLIGDAVNTTARMCTNSKDNCVNCSEFSYEEIKQKYKEFIQSTKEVKGKGMMNLYLYDPLKHRKGVMDSKNKIGRDSTGNMLMRSITKNVPVIVRQGTKGSRRESKIIQGNFKNESYNRKDSIDSSIFIVENSQDLLLKNNSNNNLIMDNQEDILNMNYNYDERKRHHSIMKKKMRKVLLRKILILLIHCFFINLEILFRKMGLNVLKKICFNIQKLNLFWLMGI